MKDFQLRNDTKLLFRNDPVSDLTRLVKGKKVLFVYGGGSVKKNGCYEDICNAVKQSGVSLYEAGNSSRERVDIQRGIQMVQKHQIDLVIGAGGASIMDCAKLIALGSCHEDFWEYVKGRKNPYGLKKLPLVLMPTYPSSGSEYGLGAVAADAGTNDFGTAYGIAADYAILAPKYSLSLSREMTAYTAPVTLVQLSASTLGDKNPVSYDCGISIIRNVLKAAKQLKECLFIMKQIFRPLSRMPLDMKEILRNLQKRSQHYFLNLVLICTLMEKSMKRPLPEFPLIPCYRRKKSRI